jgi:hypothetical protein
MSASNGSGSGGPGTVPGVILGPDKRETGICVRGNSSARRGHPTRTVSVDAVRSFLVYGWLFYDTQSVERVLKH